MKKLILLLFPLLLSAQTHRFVYLLQYKKDSLAQDFTKANMVLDINPDDIKFYPYAYAKNDSLNMIRGQKSARWDDDLPAVIRKKNSSENTSLILMNDFYSLKSNDKINWKLSDETKVDGQYTLQKATTDFGGRQWIAWFCKDINLSEGPYKFRGLPGLIFEIEDSKKNYLFKLAKSMKFSNTYKTPFLDSFLGKKPLPVTDNMIAKKQLELYNDPLHDVAESFKSNTNPENTFWVSGVQVKSIDQLKGMSDERRRVMLRDNNPIEIDKAIKYPLN
ncbi:GLPGLI family protein [Chryseobacterium sp. BIGb0232]|uniref:GLPGLI family protein n=1 Tax=Chryseobacterium sp. BIGb0232 TaxID=2940598 RepID=UPI000F4A7F16|nr:GLPGLI family protein [Chryseobacterium sp. BIGb0232]MCS4303003.1 GLPGLI family protein [Chryseobacterium sp. BIGb0232]ROS14705.1 GLPGLI family protein [Chryseobacterium nakagawai]